MISTGNAETTELLSAVVSCLSCLSDWISTLNKFSVETNHYILPFIRVGENNTSGFDGTEKDIKVIKVITHQSYHNPATYSNDIALLKLEKQATLNRSVAHSITFYYSLQIRLDEMKFVEKGS